jgi:hypothetical protein
VDALMATVSGWIERGLPERCAFPTHGDVAVLSHLHGCWNGFVDAKAASSARPAPDCLYFNRGFIGGKPRGMAGRWDGGVFDSFCREMDL